jgi:hypothetical protein
MALAASASAPAPLWARMYCTIVWILVFEHGPLFCTGQAEGASNKETHFSFLFFFSYPPFKAPPSFRAGLWNPAIQCPGRFSGITGRDPHVSKSNWLRVVIFRVFSLYHFEVYGYVPLKRLVIFLRHPLFSFYLGGVFNHLVSFMLSRETISRPWIELPTTPFGLGNFALSSGSLRSSRPIVQEPWTSNNYFSNPTGSFVPICVVCLLLSDERAKHAREPP